MTGARPRPFTQGATAERLAQYILGTMSFITPVPYPEDVGHDFQGVLHIAVAGDKKLIHSGPAFAVQVKSRKGDLVYKKDYQRKWIGEQANPFLLCVANPTRGRCDIYSTWTILSALLMHGTGIHPGETASTSNTKKVVLHPGELKRDDQELTVDDDPARHPYGGYELSADSTLTIALGPPILSLEPKDVQDVEDAKRWASLLRVWVELDRANIVRVSNGMYWVYGPKRWKTNAYPGLDSEPAVWRYFNRANVHRDPRNPFRPTVIENFVLSAIAFERVLGMYGPSELPIGPEEKAALDAVIKLYTTPGSSPEGDLPSAIVPGTR